MTLPSLFRYHSGLIPLEMETGMPKMNDRVWIALPRVRSWVAASVPVPSILNFWYARDGRRGSLARSHVLALRADRVPLEHHRLVAGGLTRRQLLYITSLLIAFVCLVIGWGGSRVFEGSQLTPHPL